MSDDFNSKCRVTQDELAHDISQYRKSVKQVHKQCVKARVEQIMDNVSEDDDAAVVLMESERFKKALWCLFRTPLTSRNTMGVLSRLTIAGDLITTAETVLTEYVESQS